tara:strand:+ start:361 stop:3417 length:3057 start_codon:yes stop_codon:yes gene_type:complete
MPVDHKIIRNSENFKGLDRRSSDLARTKEYATDMLNAAYRKTGAINKRKGFKTNLRDTNNYYGASTLTSVDSLNGNVSEEILAVNNKVHKLLDYSFNIAYAGNSDVYVSLITDGIEFKFQVSSQDTLLYDQGLGTGLGSDYTISQLKQDLDALEFTTAKIPNDTYVGTITQVSSNPNVYDYSINIPESYVNNPILLKVNEQVKIDNEHTSLLTIKSVSINYDAQDEISSYDIVLTGNSFTLNNLTTQGQGVEIKINEYNDITVTVDSAANSLPAALMDLTVNTIVQPSSVGGLDLFIKKWQEITHGDSAIVNSAANHLSWQIENENVILSDSFENASFAQVNNVMYISNGYDDVLKYDGEYVYKAGLPNASLSNFTFTQTGSQSSANSIHENKAKSILSVSLDNNPALNQQYTGQSFSLVPQGASAGTGASIIVDTDSNNYITNIDIENGGQGFAVDDVVRFTAGGVNVDLIVVEITPLVDYRTFEYKVVYEYTDYKGNVISSQPSASHPVVVNPNSKVTIDWSNLSFPGRDITGIFNDDVVSNNVITKHKHPSFSSLPDSNSSTDVQKAQLEQRLRVKIYRSKQYNPVSPDLEVVGQYYLIADKPFTTNATSFEDKTKDDDLNNFLAYDEPIKRHDPPPKGKYLSVFKNCLVTAGDPTNVNNIRYSLPKNTSTGEIGSEYFPDDENGLIIDSPFGDKITAIAPLRDLLYVFHSNSVSVMGGQINLLEQPVSELLTREGGIGCLSFHSIQEIKNTLFFLSEQGIFSIDSSNAVKEASSLINTLFLDKEVNKKRAITVNWTSKDLVIMQIPKESVTSTQRYTVEGSLIIVYDYYRDAWLKWDNIDMSGAGVVYKNNLSFLTRSSYGTDFNTMSITDTKYDFSDHIDPIDFKYETNWESLGEPTVPKKFLRLKMYAFDTDRTFESPGFTLLAGVQKNYINANLGEITFDFNTSATEGWGTPAWGEFGWASTSRPFLKSKLVPGKTQSLKLNFANNTLNENILVTNYEFEIAAPYGMEIKE